MKAVALVAFCCAPNCRSASTWHAPNARPERQQLTAARRLLAPRAYR